MTLATAVPSYAETRAEIFVPRVELPPSALAAEADTIGWDVVHALRLPVVNATIAASGRTPGSFEHELQKGWRVSGTFLPWKLVRGGSNSIVFLRAPMTDAEMTFSGIPDLVLRDSAVTVAIKLQYLPQPPAAFNGGPEPGDGDPQFLAVRDSSPNPDDPPAIVQAVDYGDVTPSAVQDALFRAAIAKWFNADLSVFTYVFCALSINGRAAQGDFQWLKPTYTGYAYANGATDEQSCFGVLTMTSGDGPEGRINQLSPAAVPGTCSASVLISRPSFLRHLMVPGLTRALPGTVDSDFAVDGASNTIRSLRQISLDKVEVDGSFYEPKVVELQLQIVGDEIQLFTKTRIEVSPGIASIVLATDFFRIGLVNKPDVTVGTSTSAVFTASTSWGELNGLSSALSRVSNSSISRVSIASGSFRVTITSGFFLELVGM